MDLHKVQTKTQLLQQSLDVLSGLNCVRHIDNVLVLPGLRAYDNSESLMMFRWESSLWIQALKSSSALHRDCQSGMLRLCGYCQSGSQTICAQVMHLKDIFFNCDADAFSCTPKDFASRTCIATEYVKSSAAAHEHLGRMVGEPRGEAEAEQEGQLGTKAPRTPAVLLGLLNPI